jgi:hypothetical protein
MATAVGRVVALGVCVLLLGGLFVLAGAGYPAPPNSGPDFAEPDVSPDDFAGEHVETGGEVIATDPVVIDVDDSTTTQGLPIENAPDVRVGQEVIVDGTLTPDGTLIANPDRAVAREPWETTYMYVISAFAVLIIAGRGIDGWRLDRDMRTLTPRETPLHQRYLGDHTADSLTEQRDSDA